MEQTIVRKKPTKGRKKSSKTDRVGSERQVALREMLTEKVRHERIALQKVEGLLEDAVSEDFLIHSAQLITVENYRDVVEERSIAKLCGYPICPNKLGQVLMQKYKISTKTNKVYDITERKCFCCNFCFKASKSFEVQISKTPLWLREEDGTNEVVLMKKEDKGSSGMEVPLVDRRLTADDIENPVLTETQEDPAGSVGEGSDGDTDKEPGSTKPSKPGLRVHWGDLPQGTEEKGRTEAQQAPQCPLNENQNSPTQSGSMVTLAFENLTVVEKCTHSDHEVAEDIMSKLSTKTQPIHVVPPQDNSRAIRAADENTLSVVQIGMSRTGLARLQTQLQKVGGQEPGVNSTKLSLLETLKLTLSEWKTEETIMFLLGSNCSTADCSTWQQEEDLDEDDLQSPVEEAQYSMWTLGNRSAHESVTAGSTGGRELLKESNTTEDVRKQTESQEAPNEGKSLRNPVLPLVDCHSQQAIQKRIVVERLTTSLKKIVGPLRISMNEVSTDLNSLVRTLRFTNTNIIHKPPEWTVIAVVFLYALTAVSSQLAESLIRPSSVEFISFMMKELELSNTDLHSLICLFCSKPSAAIENLISYQPAL